MNKLFDLNSPFMRLVSRIADLVILSFYWFVCCIPVITIGPATAALCFTAMKVARKEEIRISTTFFHSFKVNFKQGVIMNLIFIVVGAILAADLYYFAFVQQGTGTGVTLAQAAFIAMTVWALCIMFYAYPLQAQFYNPIRTTLRNAMVLAMQKPVNTAIVFFWNVFPALFAYLSVKLTQSFELIVRSAPVWVLLAPGLLAYFCAKRFVKVFDPYLKPEGEEDEEETDEE